MATLLSLAAAACDSTRASRDDARAQITKYMVATGYRVVDRGHYSCAATSGASGAGNPQSVNCMVGFGEGKLATYWQSNFSDVVVYVGCAPEAEAPPLYFGFSPYLAAFDLPSLAAVRPGAQIADSLNQLRLNSTKVASASGLPWGRTVAVLMTADSRSAADTRAAFATARLGEAANTVAIPAAQLNLGVGVAHNYLFLGARVGPFMTEAQRAAYVAAATEPVMRFRAVSRTAPFVSLDATRRSRTTDHSELGLKGARDALVDVVRQWGEARGMHIAAQEMLTPLLRDGQPSNGTECATNHSTQGCAFDTDDAAYLVSVPVPSMPRNDSMATDVVVGANPQLTRKGAYGSLVVYTSPVGGGQQSVLGGAAINSVEYSGSAALFGGDKSLYAVFVRAGGCASGERFCVNTTQTTEEHVLTYVARAYLDPETATGPDPHQILPAVVLRLRSSASPK